MRLGILLAVACGLMLLACSPMNVGSLLPRDPFIVDADFSPAQPHAGDLVTLTVEARSPNGGPLTFTYQNGGDLVGTFTEPASTTNSTSWTCTQMGVYAFIITVTDPTGSHGTSTYMLSVAP